MRITITGASGFVGRMLVQRLFDGVLADGSAATVNRIPGITLSLVVHRQSSVDHLHRMHPGSTVHRVHGWSDPELMPALEGADVLIHLAWSTVPRSAAQDPARDAQVNVEGGLHLIESAARAGVKRIVFVSSGGTVYGRRSGAPIKENVPLDPTNAYAAGKSCFEEYLGIRAAHHGMEHVILRAANLYGDPHGPTKQQGVVEHWSQCIFQRRPIEAWHGLEVVRDYLHVDDMVDALLAAIVHPLQSHVFNVGTGVGTSLGELAARLFSVAGTEVPIHVPPGAHADLPWNVLDSTLLHDQWGLAPKVALNDGLQRTWLSLHKG